MQSKIIILLRHGQTNLNRGLTKMGAIKIRETALKMKKFIQKDLIILTTNKKRTLQTAKIIARELNSPIDIFESRIKGIDNIEELIRQNQIKHIKMAKTYLALKSYSELKVETPKELFKRWNNEIKKYSQQTVIIVSHEGSLEAYLQECINPPMYKNFLKYFAYASFAVLKSDT